MPAPRPEAPTLWFGGDYNPEQWPEEVWAEDMTLMRRAGVTLATVGVFSWSRLEPEEGRHTFDWLDRVLDLLHANEVRVALATPTASPPPWFGLAHPDALPMTADGVRLTHGSRDTYAVCAPAYREACARVATALAERYRDHPALALWHVHNEYGTHSHDPHTTRAFRTWLRERYGDLDTLNATWTTAFWSQHYSAWEQITTPRATQYLPNPAQVLDYRRFLSEAMLDNYTMQRDILRAHTPDVPVTTNLAFGGWVPVDPWRWAEHVDLVAIDDYPDRPGREAATQSAFAADLARSWAGGKPWLLMEQAPGMVYSGGRLLAKAPGEITRHSLTHVARGSTGAMFFQWRASAGGAEQWHAGMVPHAGPDSRVFTEVCALGDLLPRLAEVDGATVPADATVLWDPESWWALQAPSLPAPDLDYLAAARQVHRVLWERGNTVDFGRPGVDPGDVPLVVVPMLYLTADATAATLDAYVRRGGTLVVTYLSGVARPDGQVRTGGYPGAFRELLGVRVTEFHPLPPGHELPLAPAGPPGDGAAAGPRLGAGRDWAEHVELSGAEAVVRFAPGGDPPAGLAAVTRRRHGAGTAWYVGTGLDDAGWTALLAAAAGPGPGRVAPDVETVRRVRGKTVWVFALNHGATAVRVAAADLGLAPDAVDLVSGASGVGVELTPGGVAVLRGTPAS